MFSSLSLRSLHTYMLLFFGGLFVVMLFAGCRVSNSSNTAERIAIDKTGFSVAVEKEDYVDLMEGAKQSILIQPGSVSPKDSPRLIVKVSEIDPILHQEWEEENFDKVPGIVSYHQVVVNGLQGVKVERGNNDDAEFDAPFRGYLKTDSQKIFIQAFSLNNLKDKRMARELFERVFESVQFEPGAATGN